METSWIACPCRGYLTITEEDGICRIRRWERNRPQQRNPDSREDDERDPHWKPLACGGAPAASIVIVSLRTRPLAYNPALGSEAMDFTLAL